MSKLPTSEQYCDDDEKPRMGLKEFSKAILGIATDTSRDPINRNHIWFTKLRKFYGSLVNQIGNQDNPKRYGG